MAATAAVGKCRPCGKPLFDQFAIELQDDESVDALTTTITMFEKHAWFLYASMAD